MAEIQDKSFGGGGKLKPRLPGVGFAQMGRGNAFIASLGKAHTVSLGMAEASAECLMPEMQHAEEWATDWRTGTPS